MSRWISRTGAVINIERARKKKTVAQLATRGREIVVLSMQEPKSGRVNPRTGILRSAPGEAPAVDWGKLINSIFVIADESKGAFGSSDPKAILLEMGTTDTAPRPFLTPAMEQLKEEFGTLVERWF